MRRSPLLGSLLLLLAACSGAPEMGPTPPIAPPPAPPTGAPAASAAPASAPAKAPPRADSALIPRETLFGNPERARPRLSPDGKRLAFLAPEDGVLNVWVAPADEPTAAKAITHEKKRGIRNYEWAYTGKDILYVNDKDGDENWHVYRVDLDKGAMSDLTPYAKTQARIENLSPKFPGEVVVALNDRDAENHDLYRVPLDGKPRKLLLENKAGYSGYVVDEDFAVRLAIKSRPDGGTDVLEPSAKEGTPPFMSIGSEDALTTEPFGFDSSGKTLYLVDSRGRNTAALFAMDWKTKKATLAAEDARADVAEVLQHPKDGKVQAAYSVRERRSWQVLDKALQPDFDYLRTVADGELDIVSRSLDDKRWVVAYVLSDGPVRYFLYDRGTKKVAKFLFTNQRALEGLSLAKMHAVTIKARDGLELVSYLSLPRASDPDGDGKPSAPVPMVLFVHGGPWARDSWGLNPNHQWLANRGYAVLSVNYRGSTGFGKAFINAADKEWARKMHDDLLDAVQWAVDGKIADPAKTAIMGGSYGGYATLVGLTMTPKTFACGVDIVGPSSLKTLIQSVPPYWKPMISLFRQRIGDETTPDGQKLLDERSPLTFVDRIERPLLIGQGANDPRVKQAESDQIVKAMQAKKIPVTYVLFPDEGHGFARPENRMSFNAVAETFLAQCLGGGYQPVGNDFRGASITVPAGAEEVFGLADALAKKP